jgi:hypothetical protein
LLKERQHQVNEQRIYRLLRKQLVDRQKQDNQRLKYELLRQINDQRA